MSKLLKNSSIYFATDIAIKLAMFVLLPIYTKLITPDEFGNIYLLISLSGFLTVFISLTMAGAISRFFFSKKNETDIVALYSSIIKFTFLTATPVYTILILFGDTIFYFLKLPFYPYGAITLLASYFSIYYLYISALLQAKQEAKRLSLITIISAAFNVLITFLLIMCLDDKVFAYLFSFFLSALNNFVIFLVFSRKYFSFRAKDRDLKKFVVYGVSRMPVDLSSWIVTFADSFMLYEIKGEKETGLYSIGYRLGQAIQILFMAINKAYVPFTFESFTKSQHPDDPAIRNIGVTSVRLFALYFFITFCAIVFSKELILLLDASYKDSYQVLVLILFSYLFLALKLLFQPPMDYNVKYVRIKSALWVGAAVLNIALNLWLIPLYSMNGAALATLISYGVILVPIIYFADKSIRIRYDLRKIALICLTSFVFLALLLLEVSLMAFFTKLFACAVYLFLLIRILGLRLSEVMHTLKSFRNKKKSSNGKTRFQQ